MSFLKRFRKPNWSKIAEQLRQGREHARRTIGNLNLGRLRQIRFNKEFFNQARSWAQTKGQALTNSLKNSDQVVARARELMAQKSYGNTLRLGATAMAAYFLADTVSLFTEALIPDPPPVPTPVFTKKDEKRRSISEYSGIISRNIFSSKGLIPEGTEQVASGPARKTSLPLTLVGTVVLKDELKSIAAIEDKSVSMVFPVRVDDTVADKVKITKIEHLRVYFVNQSTGQLEYVEIVDDVPTLTTEAVGGTARRTSGPGVNQTAENRFELERTLVDKATANLHEILQQARAIPNFENGQPDGYKLLQIVPGSIYDQLGLKNFDVICGINGDAISDPGKAFQLFSDLKTTSHLELCVKRNGQKRTMSYDIR
jgi:general secretion pathway protein C